MFDNPIDFENYWYAVSHRMLTDEEAGRVYDMAEKLGPLIREKDPDNEEALKAVVDLYGEPTVLEISQRKPPTDDKDQPRKPNGEYDFKD